VVVADSSYAFTYQDVVAPVMVSQTTVTSDQLQELAFTQRVTWSEFDWDEWGPLLLDHTNHIPDGEPRFPEDPAQFQQFEAVLSLLRADDPFLRFQEAFAQAQGDLRWGRASAAMIAAQTAGETFCVTVTACLLWERGDPPDSMRGLSSGDGTRLLRRHLPQLLGGQWFIAGQACESTRWQEACSSLRNRVVHAGFTPTLRQSEDAIEATIDLQRRVCDRLAHRSSQFPATALMVLGEPGFRRRNLPIVGSVRRIVEEPDLLGLARHEFRAWLDAAVVA
jgi:hypothetical protein